MARVPCIVCPNCGLHHGVAEKSCLCGAALERWMVQLIPEEKAVPRGRWDPKQPVFVQKCSYCGSLSFTVEGEAPVKQCWNCHKGRVAAVKPKLYVDEQAEVGKAEPVGDPQAAEDWASLARGVESAVAAVTQTPEQEPAGEQEQPHYEVPDEPEIVDDPGDDGEVIDWEQLFGKDSEPQPEPKPAGKKPSTLTLSARRYGKCELSLRSDGKELPCRLGTLDTLGSFLSQDPRVSRHHCQIRYEGGWIVTDTHSSNGVKVNDRLLDINASSPLRDGDLLVLGHHPDSMAFRVSIRE